MAKLQHCLRPGGQKQLQDKLFANVWFAACHAATRGPKKISYCSSKVVELSSQDITHSGITLNISFDSTYSYSTKTYWESWWI